MSKQRFFRLDRRIDRSEPKRRHLSRVHVSRFSSSRVRVTQYTCTRSVKRNDGLEKRWPPSNLVGSSLLVSASASDRYRGGFFLIEARSTIYHSRSLLRSDGSSQLDDDVAVVVVVGDRGDGDRFILEATGSDNPAALIATFNGIVMNG